MYLDLRKKIKSIYYNSNWKWAKWGENSAAPSNPSHPSFLRLFWIILSIRSEEVILFLVLLIYIKTHNRMEINL